LFSVKEYIYMYMRAFRSRRKHELHLDTHMHLLGWTEGSVQQKEFSGLTLPADRCLL
jgi:hypothetical protein